MTTLEHVGAPYLRRPGATLRLPKRQVARHLPDPPAAPVVEPAPRAFRMPVERVEAPLLPAVPKSQRRNGLNLVEAVRISIEGLTVNKTRSFLTMLGIIIGVSAVIVMVALGQGVAKASQEAIQKLGTNALTIMPNSQMKGGVSQGLGSLQTLKLEDADVIRKKCPAVQAVAPGYQGSAQVKWSNQNTRTTVMGSTPEYFDIRNLPISDGRTFTDQDVRRRAKVVVIGDNIRQTLFGDAEAVGQTIKVNGQNFDVVGVTEPRGASGFRSPDDQITIPVTTAMYRLFGVTYINSISAQAVSDKQMDEAQSEITDAISRAHRLAPGDPPDIRVFNQADISESAQQQSSFLTMLLAGIALVSLIVGGIGIMNIMLVSVTERTREIGIRKAIGAKRKDILYQFLIESITISLVGGLIGLALGVGGTLWAGLPKGSGGLGYPMQLTAAPMIASFCFSAAVGVFFGIYPALKASALNPIIALKYE